jgi:hypothetical protein
LAWTAVAVSLWACDGGDGATTGTQDTSETQDVADLGTDATADTADSATADAVEDTALDAATADAVEDTAQDTATLDAAEDAVAPDVAVDEVDTSTPSYPAATRVVVGRAFDANSATICIFRQDAEPWCWGLDIQGQAFGKGTVALVKGQELALSEVVDFAASNTAACALKKGGTLWCVGEANMPGTGNNAPWTQVTLPNAPTLKAIFAGYAGFAALATNGDVYGFGYSLGFGGPFAEGPKLIDSGVAQVLSGMAATVFLKDALPDTVFGNFGWEVPNYTEATPVAAPFDIAGGNAGWDSTVLLAADGTLWGIGRNDNKLTAELGAWKEWKQLPSIPGVVEVVTHSAGACALLGSGEVHCFGMASAPLGRPPVGDGHQPAGAVQFNGQPLTGIAHIYAGMSTMIALGKDGSVWMWGFGPAPTGGSGGWPVMKIYPPAP